MLTKHRTGYLFKRGPNFYVRWIVEGKTLTKALRDENGQSITNRREAEEARTKFMAAFTAADEAEALENLTAKLKGRQGELARIQDTINPPLAITEAWSAFLNAPNRPDSGASTLRQYEFQFSAFADWMKKEHPQQLALRDVAKALAEDYAAHLCTRKLSPNTYNKHLNLLGLVFRVLKDKARLTDNPWLDLQRKRLATHSRRELTLEELRKVCQSATGELQTLLALGVYSGLRLGDCATLRWGEVDLGRGIIRRVPNKTARRQNKPVVIPIHATLKGILEQTPVRERGEFVLPQTAEKYYRRIDEVTDLIQRHLRECGIQPHKPETGKAGNRAVVEVGFHSLRHTFVSLCRESNTPLAVVESIVGHSNPAMTRYYTHVGEAAAGRAVATLPSVLETELPKALPPAPPNSETAFLDNLRATAKAITASNWRTQKQQILAQLDQHEATTRNGAAEHPTGQ